MVGHEKYIIFEKLKQEHHTKPQHSLFFGRMQAYHLHACSHCYHKSPVHQRDPKTPWLPRMVPILLHRCPSTKAGPFFTTHIKCRTKLISISQCNSSLQFPKVIWSNCRTLSSCALISLGIPEYCIMGHFSTLLIWVRSSQAGQHLS